jgi:hypothetical protein
MRALDDQKGENRDMALSKAQKQQVIEMLLNGENPNDFIKQCGIKNPTCTVWNLKNYLKKYDPETWKKIQPKTETPETVPAPIGGGKWEKMETPESNKLKVAVIGKPETVGELKREKRYTVTAIQYPEIGEFYYDRKYNTIDWRTPEGEEVSMSPTGWKLLMQDLKEIMTVLGVEL